MSAASKAEPITDAEAAGWFADLSACKALVLAVSGGPDSTALCLLAARWRAARKDGPALLAVTVDHGLRPEARREAGAVKRFAATLGIPHRTVTWTGPKPKSGLQEAARTARYRLLAAAARRVEARHILTAHTLDDQAETVLFRLARGSGLAGLGAMARVARLPFNLNSPLPACEEMEMLLVRPFLDVPKARLITTLVAANIPYAEDPSNRDPRFTRARLRAAMPVLAAEGLTAARLAQLAKRARRAEEAIEAAVNGLTEKVVSSTSVPAKAGSVPAKAGEPAPQSLATAEWRAAPAEIRLRMLGRLIAIAGNEGPVELGKLESVEKALTDHLSRHPNERFRRTLAGAVVTAAKDRLTVERAPPRQKPRAASARRLTQAEVAGVHQPSAK
ncbi:MAG: tRNA lysidine(34) synthetase TilS [Xanthobacteraceae bacterium]